MPDFQDPIEGRMHTRIPSGESLNPPGRAVNQIECLAPGCSRSFDFLLTSHGKYGKPIQRQQKILKFPPSRDQTSCVALLSSQRAFSFALRNSDSSSVNV